MPDGGNPSSGEEIPLPPRIKDVIVIGAGQSPTPDLRPLSAEIACNALQYAMLFAPSVRTM